MAKLRAGPGSLGAKNLEGAEQATTRKRGKRGEGRRLRRQMEREARERQAAWAETGQPDRTRALTSKLARDSADLREALAGDPGDPCWRAPVAAPDDRLGGGGVMA